MLTDPEQGSQFNHAWTSEPQLCDHKLYVLVSHVMLGSLLCSDRELIDYLVFWIIGITFKLSSLIYIHQSYIPSHLLKQTKM